MKEYFNEFHENTEEYFKLYEPVKGGKKHSVTQKKAVFSGFPLASAAAAALILLAMIAVFCSFVKISPESATLQVSVYDTDGEKSVGYFLFPSDAEPSEQMKISGEASLQKGSLREGDQELYLENLVPDTEYLIVFYSEDPEGQRETLSEYRFRTAKSTGSVSEIETVPAAEDQPDQPDEPEPHPEIVVEIPQAEETSSGEGEPSHADDVPSSAVTESSGERKASSSGEPGTQRSTPDPVSQTTEPTGSAAVTEGTSSESIRFSSGDDSGGSDDSGGGSSGKDPETPTESGTEEPSESSSEEPSESESSVPSESESVFPSESSSEAEKPVGGPIVITDSARIDAGHAFYFTTGFRMNGCEAEKAEIHSPAGTVTLQKEELSEDEGLIRIDGEAIFPKGTESGTIRADLYYRDQNGKAGIAESETRTVQIGYIEESNSQSMLKLIPSDDGIDCDFECIIAGIHHGTGEFIIDSLRLILESAEATAARTVIETIDLPAEQTDTDHLSFAGNFPLPGEGEYTVTVRAEGHWEMEYLAFEESYGEISGELSVKVQKETEANPSGEWSSEPSGGGESNPAGESAGQGPVESESVRPGEPEI